MELGQTPSQQQDFYVFTFPDPQMLLNSAAPFNFSSTVGLSSDISIQPPLPPPRNRKRPRPSTWLSHDDPVLPSTKKRRLRLVLITSPLSRPFSTPASYIADHGKSRIAIWAKARHLRGRSLRRAAILNSARRNGWGVGTSPNSSAFEDRVWSDETTTKKELKDGVGPDEDVQGEADLLGAIRQDRNNNGLGVPSPLGLSNYDAFDDWKGYTISHHDDDPLGSSRVPQAQYIDEDEEEDVYSDFNFLDPVVSSPQEDDEYDDPFTVLPPEWYRDDRPLRPPDEIVRHPQPVGSAA